MSGPRIGVTYISGPRADDMLSGHHLRPVMMQFGWHAEEEVIGSARGPRLVIEEVILVGGVEQNSFVPSATFLMGVRTPGGFEAGVGPNIDLTGTGMAVALGHSFTYGSVRIPVDLGMVNAHGAMRLTLLTGFAVERDN